MILNQSSFISSASIKTQTFHLQYQFSSSNSTLDTTMSRLFWRIPITGYTCDIHGVPVVWRVTPSYITPRVDFTIRYWSQGALIYKEFTINPESPEWSTLISAAAPYAHDFNLVEDLLDWMARQSRSHL